MVTFDNSGFTSSETAYDYYVLDYIKDTNANLEGAFLRGINGASSIMLEDKNIGLNNTFEISNYYGGWEECNIFRHSNNKYYYSLKKNGDFRPLEMLTKSSSPVDLLVEENLYLKFQKYNLNEALVPRRSYGVLEKENFETISNIKDYPFLPLIIDITLSKTESGVELNEQGGYDTVIKHKSLYASFAYNNFKTLLEKSENKISTYYENFDIKDVMFTTVTEINGIYDDMTAVDHSNDFYDTYFFQNQKGSKILENILTGNLKIRKITHHYWEEGALFFECSLSEYNSFDQRILIKIPCMPFLKIRKKSSLKVKSANSDIFKDDCYIKNYKINNKTTIIDCSSNDLLESFYDRFPFPNVTDHGRCYENNGTQLNIGASEEKNLKEMLTTSTIQSFGLNNPMGKLHFLFLDSCLYCAADSDFNGAVPHNIGNKTFFNIVTPGFRSNESSRLERKDINPCSLGEHAEVYDANNELKYVFTRESVQIDFGPVGGESGLSTLFFINFDEVSKNYINTNMVKFAVSTSYSEETNGSETFGISSFVLSFYSDEVLIKGSLERSIIPRESDTCIEMTLNDSEIITINKGKIIIEGKEQDSIKITKFINGLVFIDVDKSLYIENHYPLTRINYPNKDAKIEDVKLNNLIIIQGGNITENNKTLSQFVKDKNYSITVYNRITNTIPPNDKVKEFSIGKEINIPFKESLFITTTEKNNILDTSMYKPSGIGGLTLSFSDFAYCGNNVYNSKFPFGVGEIPHILTSAGYYGAPLESAVSTSPDMRKTKNAFNNPEYNPGVISFLN